MQTFFPPHYLSLSFINYDSFETAECFFHTSNQTISCYVRKRTCEFKENVFSSRKEITTEDGGFPPNLHIC